MQQSQSAIAQAPRRRKVASARQVVAAVGIFTMTNPFCLKPGHGGGHHPIFASPVAETSPSGTAGVAPEFLGPIAFFGRRRTERGAWALVSRCKVSSAKEYAMRNAILAIAFAGLIATAGAAMAQTNAQPSRSAASLECSKQADDKGLHGKARKSFRAKCLKSAKQNKSA